MAYFRCGGGPIRQVGGSVILASNPTITVTKDNSNETFQATITWSKPSSEVTIDHYNVYVYKSDTAPTSLKQFTLVTSISNQLTYTIGGLSINQTYYFVVTSVTEANYENASIKNKKSVTFYETNVDCLFAKTSDDIYYSSNGINWGGIYSSIGIPYNISYGYGENIFYTESDAPKFSKDGKTWSEITGLEQSTPSGTERQLTGPIAYPNTYYAMGFRAMRSDLVVIDKNGSCETFDSNFYARKVYGDTKLWSIMGSLRYVSSIRDGKVYFNDSTTDYVTGDSFVKPVELGNRGVIATNTTKVSYTGYIYYTSVYEGINNKLVLSVDGHIVDLCSNRDSNVVASCDRGAFYSTDCGATWSEITDGIKPVNCHVAYDRANDTFIAIDDAKVYMCPGYDLTRWQYRGAHNLSGTIEYVIGK